MGYFYDIVIFFSFFWLFPFFSLVVFRGHTYIYMFVLLSYDVGEVSSRFDISCADSLDNLCYCFSQLCWMQNLILNRMAPFLQGVIGKKRDFTIKIVYTSKKTSKTSFSMKTHFFPDNPL